LFPLDEPDDAAHAEAPAASSSSVAAEEPEPQFTSAGTRVWRVQALVAALTRHVEQRFRDVRVEGEVSNCRTAPSGHIYFTLKDGQAQLPVVMFRMRAQMLRFSLEDGMQVRVRGRVSVYEARGQMQLMAELLEPLGDGALRLAFEQLKQRLAAEGLFDPARKRPLPPFPRTIGIITSPTGSVIRDILHVLERRARGVHVLLYPATVQGETAAVEFRNGLRWFQSHSSAADVIILARGGGSAEDLNCFNDESLARAIAVCDVPVVSAIGHETDFTIADFVADLRAPTPSAAAEMVTQNHLEVRSRLQSFDVRLERGGRYRMMLARELLSAVISRPGFAAMRDYCARRLQRVDELSYRLAQAERRRTQQARNSLESLALRLARQDVSQRLANARMRCEALSARQSQAINRLLSAKRGAFFPAVAQLDALSPVAILERGYAVIYDSAGSVVRDSADVNVGDALTARLARGRITTSVTAREIDPTAPAKRSKRKAGK
jgi:exodeoxyribonuclease VII large subunit